MCVCLHRWFARLIAALVFFASSHSVLAFVPPSYNGKMNQAVGSLIESKTSKWGMPPADPRVGATSSAVGAALTAAALIAIGSVGAATWPAVLGLAGLGALATFAIPLATDGVTKWLFGEDGSVTQYEGDQPEQFPAGAAQTVWCAVGACAPTREAACNNSPSQMGTVGGVPVLFTYSYLSDSSQCMVYQQVSSDGVKTAIGPSGMTQRTGCPGIALEPVSGMCPPSNFSPVGTIVFLDADAAVDALPQEMAQRIVSDELLAAVANTAWKGAASSPDSIPWSASDPITPADVQAWRQANPELVPTVGDFAAPAVGPNGQVSVAPSPSSGSGNGTTAPTTPGQGQQVDLGPDPNLGPPGLEPIPTAAQILGPLLNLMPDLKGFSVPGHVAQCPKPGFTAFDRQYIFEAHCGLFESNRSLIEAAMLLVWAVLSVFIVLRA